MSSTIFNSPTPGSFPLFTTVDAIKGRYGPDVNVIVSIGGWGDTSGFTSGASTDSSRKLFAKNVKAMLDHTGADGVDIDWEYPGGNGEDYKQIPNSAKVSEITTYPQLLSEIRAAIGNSKIMCAAVPGLQRDMIAFTKDTIPKIISSLDFMNIMTYDLMNRRDTVTKHHTSIEGSIDTIKAYLDYGLPPEKANLGFGFYSKWFTTESGAGCASNPIGCKTVLLENSDGSDTGHSGALTFTSDGGGTSGVIAASWQKALAGGKTDESAGGQYFWDADTNIFWTWDTTALIAKKFSSVVQRYKLGGVFGWALGEDSADWSHLKALTEGVKNASKPSLSAPKLRKPFFEP
ncbi:MAG: hypothetical protein M1829_000590 [Trizodia sp. TS-e1964]|nr:MAG: hypothetical protein M1829_000590 [Trizodia sp. TS-e1964]